MKRIVRSKQGITLIELLVTTVIIGIVATMAVPRFQAAYEKHKFNSVNRDVISSFRLARSMAITDKEQYGINFDIENGIYTLFKDKINLAGYDFVAGDSVLRVDTMPPEFSYIITDVENHTFLFRPNGSSRYNGGGNVVLLASSENVTAIFTDNILTATGRVQSVADFY